ncbi:MAG: magnesium/cobalt transporter CorA [bacterium]|nr:magnesium/cobalt transporter CorA [bacterium]MDT8395538.1 magnesium/cobalt transporter CorA [bacterium]
MERVKGKVKRRRVFHRRTMPGEVPGTVQTDPGAPFPVIHIISFSPEESVEVEHATVEEIGSCLEKWPVTWVNVDGLGDADTLIALAELFGIHGLALEDVVHVHQRPKVEEYEDNLFIVARMLSLAEGRVGSEQVGVFLGDRFVLTFQERQGDCLDPVRERIRKARGRIRKFGADYLAYAILDAVVDAWFPLLEDYGELLDNLEVVILDEPDETTVNDIHRVKRDLMEIRRTVWPMRETVNSLFRNDSFIKPETQLYLRDCYDHVAQVIDMVESYRDMASGLMDVYLSSISNRMNEVMKVLTIIATIFIPLTFVAGIYGMNFNTEASPFNMPELNWKYGYPAFWGLMLVIGGAMALFFRSRGWLGGGKRPRS